MSARYEPEYEALNLEIEALGSLTGKKVDWEKVVECGTTILRDKSKDLLVASYLAFGLFKLRGMDGLVAGLTICRDLLKTYWDGLFPELKRIKARGTALQWLAQRLQQAVEQLPPPADPERAALVAVVELFKGLQTVMDEKLGRDAPAFGPLRRVFEARIDAIPAAAPPPPPPPPPSAAPTPATASTVTSTATVTSSPTPAPSAPVAPPPHSSAPGAPSAPADVSGVAAMLDSTWESLARTADLLLSANDADPLAYLVRRTGWRDLTKLPAASGNVLGFPGGEPGLLTQLEAASAAGDHAGVLRLAEPAASRMRLWIETSFQSMKALEALGKKHEAARDAVASELIALGKRLPALADLSFKNGIPLLSPAGRAWLKGELSGGGGGGGAADPIDAALGKARAKLKDGLPAALAALGETPPRTGTRGRFRWRMAMARLALEAGQADLAGYQLEGLDAERTRHGLDEFEPPLVVELLTLRFKALQALTPKPKDAPERARAIYVGLCQLDPTAALALGPV